MDILHFPSANGQPVKVLFESADASLLNLITKYTPVYINDVNINLTFFYVILKKL